MAIEPEGLQPERDEWTTPAITLHTRLRLAREKAGIKSVHDMAPLLAAELHRPVAGSTAAAWEKGTNQPTRGVRMEDYVRAYSRITKVPLSWFYEDLLTRCNTDAPALTCLDGPEGDLQLSLAFPPELALLAASS
jgi:hypothetical protein